MSILDKRSKKLSAGKGHEQTVLNVGKVKITPLPRRNDDISLRGLRRRRA